MTYQRHLELITERQDVTKLSMSDMIFYTMNNLEIFIESLYVIKSNKYKV
jgi:hypothetical protein